MDRNPTYEELQHRVRQLEAECRRLSAVEAKLQRHTRLTETLLDTVPVPIFFKDAQGRYQGCNRAFTEATGAAAEEIRGKTALEIWPGGHAEAGHRKDLDLLKKPKRRVYESEITDKNGDVRPVIFHKGPFHEENGEVAGLVGAFVDVTERRQAEVEQQAMFSMSLYMLCIADIHTATFLKVNPAFMETLGYSEQELLERPFTDMIHPDDLAPTWEIIEESLRRGKKVINFKNRYRRKDGAYRWINWVAQPLPEKGLSYAVAHDITDEIEANAALRRQRDLLNILFESLSLGVTVWDADGRLRMTNKGFFELTGYTGEEIRTLDDWFFKAYPDAEYRRQVIADWKVSKQSSDAVREFKVTCKGGHVKDVEFRSAFLKDGRALVTLADITERKRAQEERLARQQFLESMLYHLPDAIVTLDSAHRVIDWNPGAVGMFGYRPEEAIGVQLDDLVARGRSRVEAGEYTRRVLSGRRLEAFETVRYRKDGTPIRVIAAGSPIMVDGALTGVVAVYTDITARVQAEEALRASEEKFRMLVEQSPLGYALIGKEGRYRYINPAFEKMFGYTLEDIPDGTAWFRRAFPDKPYRKETIQTWRADLEKGAVGQPRSRLFTVTCKDGARRTIHFRPVTMENGDQFLIYEDVTEKRNLELQFQQSQKFEAIGTLAGGIAHDFNNLLMGIQGRTSLIAVDLPPSDPHLEHLRAIEDHIRSATDLTRQLLGFARGGKYEVKPGDINELVVGSAAMFGRTKKEIRIHAKTPPGPLVVEADRRQIEQVLLNIFVNAWQAMPAGGDIFLETAAVELDEAVCSPHQAAPGRYAKVAITDTGIGMDDDTRGRIFDPFFTTKEKGRGTGLGLASAYGIVHNHGGLITVASEVGNGATFTIYLPLSDAPMPQEKRVEDGLLKGSETILLVDDEEMILEVGRAMLEKLGYRVYSAVGGREAVSTVAEKGGQIDLVILDLIMPGYDGGKAFDRIRDLRPDMPVMLSSGYAIDGQAAEILQRGCNGFIQKPFTIPELSREVRSVLDAAKGGGRMPARENPSP